MVSLAKMFLGLSYIATSLVFAFTNGILFYVLLRYKKYHTTTYRIIISMLLGTVMQLMSHFVGGVLTAGNLGKRVHLENIAGAWMQTGWLVYLGSSLALAVDRTLTFIKIFSERTAKRISVGFVAFSWLTGLIYFVLLLLPNRGFAFYTGNGYGTWYYDDQPATDYLETLEMILDFVITVSVLLLYCLVFVRIVLMRKAAHSHITSSSVELRILSIAVISFVTECSFLLWFFWGRQLIAEGMLSAAIVTLLWIVNCGLFSLVTIVINTSIRKKVHHLWRWKKAVNTVVVLSKLHSTTAK